MGASAATGRSGAARATRVATGALAAALVGYAVSDHPFYGGTAGFGAAQAVIVGLGLATAACLLLPLSWNRRVLLALCSGLFMLALLELALELVFAHRYRPGFRYHDRLIFELVPDRYNQFVHSPENGGHSVMSRTNRAGFRGEELLEGKDHLRVAVYGDSFIHALYTPLEETFVEQLERALASGLGRPVEAVNAGVASYGPDQVSLKLDSELPWLKPDLVVLAVYGGNDYGDLLKNKLFRLDDRGRLQPNAFRLDPALRDSFDAAGRESVLKRALRDLVHRWRPPPVEFDVAPGEDPEVARVEGWLRAAIAEYEEYVVGRNDIVTDTHVDRYNAAVTLMPHSKQARYQVQLMEGVLKRSVDRLRQAGVGFVLLFIPHPADVYPGYRFGRIDRARYPDYRKSNATDALEEMARRNGWPFLNLFPLYDRPEVDKLYLKGGDDHWSSRGQAVAAEALARYVLEAGILPR